MDVKTAFLNGELEEEVYTEKPEGYLMQGQEKKVCKLVKSLYELKQAPKQWHQKFNQVNLSNGFRINESDKCVYSRFVNGKGVIIYLYVDDMLIFGTDLEQVQMTKKILSKNLDIKDLGEADVILGIKILLKENRLITHTSSPGKEHWDAINRVFKYLKETMDYGLEYNRVPSVLGGYTDASWITDQEDYASTSGWIFTLGGGVVSWGSKKQSFLTHSTMAAKFVVLASCCK
ncbi:zinc finger, CCHC-type containing protein [Tanacetum coccineum]